MLKKYLKCKVIIDTCGAWRKYNWENKNNICIKLIMRNICLISDGRTSHGIYKPVLDQISKSKN